MPWSLYHANLIVHLSFTMTLYTWNVLLLITLFKFHLILFNAFENQLFWAIFRLQAVNNRKCNHLSHKTTPQCQSFLFFKNSSTSFSWCKLYLSFSHQLNQPADSLERTVQSLVFQLQTIFSTFYVSICVFLASILDVELFFSGISCYRLLIKLVVIPSTSNNTTLTKVFPQQIFLILTPPVLFLAYQLLFLLSPSINLFPTITTFSPCTLCARISSCIRRFFFFFIIYSWGFFLWVNHQPVFLSWYHLYVGCQSRLETTFQSQCKNLPCISIRHFLVMRMRMIIIMTLIIVIITAWKVSIFRVFLLRIFPPSD